MKETGLLVFIIISYIGAFWALPLSNSPIWGKETIKEKLLFILVLHIVFIIIGCFSSVLAWFFY